LCKNFIIVPINDALQLSNKQRRAVGSTKNNEPLRNPNISYAPLIETKCIFWHIIEEGIVFILRIFKPVTIVWKVLFHCNVVAERCNYEIELWKLKVRSAL